MLLREVSTLGFALVLSLVILSGCTGSDSKPQPIEQDRLVYEVPLDIFEEGLPEKELQIYKDIRDSKRASFSLMTSAIMDQQFERVHASKVDETHLRWVEASAAINKETPIFQIKTQVESVIENNMGRPLKYNLSAIHLDSVLLEGKIQCFSGTQLFLNSLRSIKTGHQFRNENIVAIFESGHVLPGKMVKMNGEWRLFGIEMTGAGDAIIDYGLASQLDSSTRVVDAELYQLTQLFRTHFKTADSQLAAAVSSVEFTAKKYGINSSEVIKIMNESYSKKVLDWSGESKLSQNTHEVSDLVTLLKATVGDSFEKRVFEKYLESFTAKSLKEFKISIEEKLDGATLKLAKGFSPTPKQLLSEILELDISILKSNVENLMKDRKSNSNFNSSLFSFGKPSTPNGDLERTNVGMSSKELQSALAPPPPVTKEPTSVSERRHSSNVEFEFMPIRGLTSVADLGEWEGNSEWLVKCKSGLMLRVFFEEGAFLFSVHSNRELLSFSYDVEFIPPHILLNYANKRLKEYTLSQFKAVLQDACLRPEMVKPY